MRERYDLIPVCRMKEEKMAGKERGGKKRRSHAEVEYEKRYDEVRSAFAAGQMPSLLERYLMECGACTTRDGVGKDGERNVKKARRLPNPAGFCRFLGLSREAFSELFLEFPHEAGRICAVFEDEALNSDLPASILSLYLKYLLTGGAEIPRGTEEDAGENGEGAILVTFEHDILTDGR